MVVMFVMYGDKLHYPILSTCWEACQAAYAMLDTKTCLKFKLQKPPKNYADTFSTSNEMETRHNQRQKYANKEDLNTLPINQSLAISLEEVRPQQRGCLQNEQLS